MLLPPVILDEDEGVEVEELEDDWPGLDLFSLVFFANNSTCVWQTTITEVMSATATNTVSRLVLTAIPFITYQKTYPIVNIFSIYISIFESVSWALQ
jgi:hypothetical protein